MSDLQSAIKTIKEISIYRHCSIFGIIGVCRVLLLICKSACGHSGTSHSEAGSRHKSGDRFYCANDTDTLIGANYRLSGSRDWTLWEAIVWHSEALQG